MKNIKAEFKVQPINLILISLMVIIYLAEVYAAGGLTISTHVLFQFGASFTPSILLDNEWWRLITAGFLHITWMHITFNLVILYWIGRLLEQAIGSWRYLGLFLVTDVIGNLFGMAFGSVNVISAGASGAIYGLFGTFIVLGVLARWQGFWGDQARTIGVLVILSMATSLFASNIDLWAHIGGVLGGIVFTPILISHRVLANRFKMPELVRSLSIIVTIGMVVALIILGVNHGYANFY